MKFKSIDPASVGQSGIYQLLISSIVPRPIGWISTLSNQNIGNLAPFSFFNGVSSDPPALMFCCTGKDDGSDKDTLRNILETKDFVFNFVTESIVEKMHQTSAAYDFGVDEMKKAGLTPLPSQKVKPFRVGESPIQLECRLLDTLKIGGRDHNSKGSSTIVVGEIIYAHVAKNVLDPKNGLPDVELLKPVARLGGPFYSTIGKIFKCPPAKTN